MFKNLILINTPRQTSTQNSSSSKHFIVKFAIVALALIGAYKMLIWLRLLLRLLCRRYLSNQTPRVRTYNIDEEFFNQNLLTNSRKTSNKPVDTKKKRNYSVKHYYNNDNGINLNERDLNNQSSWPPLRDADVVTNRKRKPCCGKCCGCQGRKR